jgi:hypothetical protein
MKILNNARLLQLSGLAIGSLIWLANNVNPPCGTTGAPFDGSCASASCHGTANTNGYDGTVSLDGLPTTIQSNTTYPLTLTVTYSAGTPIKAGFQVVSVAADNSNAGIWTNVNGETSVASCGTRSYLGHHNGKVFSGNSVTWNFNWKSPATANGDQITFYYMTSFTDGDGTSNGDWSPGFNLTLPFQGVTPVTASISSVTDVTCNGGNDGSATVEPGGGTPPYTYHWSNNQTTQTAVNLAAGTYTVTVTGSAGSGTATAVATVAQPPAVVVTASVNGTISCINSSVTGTAVAAGGSGGFTYEWSNGQSGSTTTFTAGGTYVVTATDNQGCTGTASVTVVSTGTPPTAVAVASGPITCLAANVTVNGTGSSTGNNFTYSWTTVNGNIVSGSTTLIATVNQPGVYVLKVTNTATGCTKTASATVVSSTSPPNASATGGAITCANPTVQISGNSTTQGVTYAWSGPGGFASTQQNPTVNTAGTYTVTVTNPANGCTATATAQVTGNTTAPVAVATASGPLSCADTTVTVNGTGSSTGTNITYQWTTVNGHLVSGAGTLIATVDQAGTYVLAVTDVTNGCSATASATVTNSAQTPNATATGDTITCALDSVTIHGHSTTPGVTYSWTGPNGFTSTQQNPVVHVGGTYSLTVLDTANHCAAKATALVGYDTIPPVAVAKASGPLSCSDTTVVVDGTGSSTGPNITYKWTTTDGHIVSGSNTLIATVDKVGAYALLVTDTVNGCSSKAVITVTSIVQAPNATATGDTITCSKTSVTIKGNSTTPGVSYSWAGPNGFTSAQQNPVVNAGGTYTLTVKNPVNGCTAVATAVVKLDTTPPSATATAGLVLTCVVTSSQLTGNSTTAGATFAWTGPNGFTSSQQNPKVTVGGVYKLVVTGPNGCTASASVTENQNTTAPGASATGGAITCNAPKVTLAGTSSSTHATFAWSGPGGNSTQQNFQVSVPGVYALVVTDTVNGCTSTASATVTQSTSTVKIQCPAPVVVTAATGAQTAVATFAQATGTTDCTCPGVVITQSSGLASGSAFPIGVDTICFTAKDSCGQSASCCFTVTVLESTVCDVKILECMKYELLTITQDAALRKTYRIRLTNSCPSPMVYAAFQLPNGLTAVRPHDGDLYTAPSGRNYLARNPNFSPFYSVRFLSQVTGIANGASDIFSYTLPPQASVTYIHVIAKVESGGYFETYLNTFNCPVGNTPGPASKPVGSALVYPNPTQGNLFVNLSAWQGQRLHLAVFDSRGRQVLETEETADFDAQELLLPAQIAPGLYFLRIMDPDGGVNAVRFMVE